MIYCIPIRVECYSGSRALNWEGRRFEVKEILDRWYQGSYDPVPLSADYFKVHTKEGGEYIIKHERDSHAWYLVSEQD